MESCPHLWNQLRPVGKPGIAHCGACGQDIECPHPVALINDNADIVAHCEGCEEVFRSRVSLMSFPNKGSPGQFLYH